MKVETLEISPDQFLIYRKLGFVDWKCLYNQRVCHKKFGWGSVIGIDLENPSDPSIWIVFDISQEGKDKRQFSASYFSNDFFNGLSLLDEVANIIRPLEIERLINLEIEEEFKKRKNELTKNIADLIKDYRLGEIEMISPIDVENWAIQFHFEGNDEFIMFLEGVKSFIQKYYLSKERMLNAIRAFITYKPVFGDTPQLFLKNLNFLNIQRYGYSQKEMIKLIDQVMSEFYDLEISECGGTDHYLYVDDCLYSGNRVINDIKEYWSKEGSPNDCDLMIYYVAVYSSGLDYAKKELDEFFSNKNVRCRFFWGEKFDNDRDKPGDIDFIWPSIDDKSPVIKRWIDDLISIRKKHELGKKGLFRPKGSPREERVFQSPAIRNLIENKFLEQGIQIIVSMKEYENIRPLGFDKLLTLGHGALFISYRNIANNCPVVLWVDGQKYGQSWKPLFRRKQNSIDKWWW